jgi:hypothetical protein
LCREPDPRRGKLRIHGTLLFPFPFLTSLPFCFLLLALAISLSFLFSRLTSLFPSHSSLLLRPLSFFFSYTALEEILLVVEHTKKQLENNPYTPPLRPRSPSSSPTTNSHARTAEVDLSAMPAAPTLRQGEAVDDRTSTPFDDAVLPAVVDDSVLPNDDADCALPLSSPGPPSPPLASNNPWASHTGFTTTAAPPFPSSSLAPSSSPPPPRASDPATLPSPTAVHSESSAEPSAEQERASSRARGREEREEDELAFLRRFDRPRRAY